MPSALLADLICSITRVDIYNVVSNSRSEGETGEAREKLGVLSFGLLHEATEELQRLDLGAGYFEMSPL